MILLTPFQDSPDEGDPACLCSVCGLVIPAFDEDGYDNICVRMWPDREDCDHEYRFHDECIALAIEAKVLMLKHGSLQPTMELPLATARVQ
jgi:hypothetical protein